MASVSEDDHVVTRIEFRMVVDGRLVSVIFSRPEKIVDLLTEEKCSLGEWLRALRDSPEVPEVPEASTTRKKDDR